MIPIVAETCNVIDADFDVFDGLQNFFHDLLSNIRRLANTHGQAIALAETKGCCDSAQGFAFIVENKRAVLHGNIEFREEFAS